MSAQPNQGPSEPTAARKRTRMVRPYPNYTLEESSAVATTIQQVNAGLPFDRVLLAKAMGTTPASSSFTMKLNSSAKYGLTQGGYNDSTIALTPRGESVVSPQRSEERREAILAAAMQPELIRDFYRMLEGKRLPEDAYAHNMLQRELGVHASLAAECLDLVKANGLYAGLLTEMGGALYVSLAGAHAPEGRTVQAVAPVPAPTQTPRSEPAAHADRTGKIFIGHAGAVEVVDFIKATLDTFGIPYGVLNGDLDDHRPLADQMSDAMGECDAAILVFAGPPGDSTGETQVELTRDKMIYQLGAASVLFGQRILLLRATGEIYAVTGEHALTTLEFRRDRIHEMGLRLLAELHRMAVIEVRAV